MTTQQHHQQPDFNGKHIYVGSGVHKRSWAVSVHTDTSEYKTFSQDPRPELLAQWLNKSFPGATYHSVYEAGFSGFWVDEALRAAGVHNVVVNPADIPTAWKDRIHKTDTVDARKLAQALRQNALTAIWVPPRSACEDKALLRTYRRLLWDQTRVKNRIKAFLNIHGIVLPAEFDKRYWSKPFIEWLKTIELSRAGGTMGLQLMVRELDALRPLIREALQLIRTLAKTWRYSGRVELLETIPGIGLMTAMILLTELVSFERFHTTDALLGYIGLVPGTHSSGEHERVGKMTHRGNAYVRCAIIESAWRAIHDDPVLLAFYEDARTRMNPNRAIVKVARKLLARMRWVMMNHRPYVSGVCA